jgi:hypothetical protein
MSELSDRTYHLDKISTALWQARNGFTEKGGLEGDRETFLALVKATTRELNNIAMVCTGKDYLDSLEESASDDAALCFKLAIEDRDGDRPVPRRAPSGIAYDHSRA